MKGAVTLLEGLGNRLREGLLPQYGLLLLLLLAISLATLWSSAGADAHQVWYRFAPWRSLAVAFFTIGFGMSLPGMDRQGGLVLALAVVVVVLSTVPLEALAHLRSQPALSRSWMWWSTPLVVAGQLALGDGLARGLQRLRLLVVAPVLVPLMMIAFIVLDIHLGVNLLNPWTAPLQVSWSYPALYALLALVAIGLRWRRAALGVTGAA